MTRQWIVTVHDYRGGQDRYFGPYRTGQEAEHAAANLLTAVYERHPSPDDVIVAFSPLRAASGITAWLSRGAA